MPNVAGEQQTTTLLRDVRVGDSVSFDNGRVVVTVEKKAGQSARLRFTLSRTVAVDKPPKPQG